LKISAFQDQSRSCPRGRFQFSWFGIEHLFSQFQSIKEEY
jgi:hypothetical protein